MSDPHTFRKILEERHKALALELEAFEGRIDEEVGKMREEFGPRGKFVGPGYTRLMGRMDIQFRALREDIRLLQAKRAKDRLEGKSGD